LAPDGPPEWQALNQQYDEVLDRRTEDVMRELELDDLADLFRKDRQAFDAAIEQGRRAFLTKMTAATRWLDSSRSTRLRPDERKLRKRRMQQ
jgi:hypothetical protein